MTTTTCPSCGDPFPPGAAFCDNCGYDLRTVAAAPASALPATQLTPQPEATACLACGFLNVDGAGFCENCGAKLGDALATAPQPVVRDSLPPAPQPVAAPPIPQSLGVLSVVGGVSLPIPQGKSVILIGREDPVSGIFPEIDLDPHGGQDAGVGRRHAQLLVQGGQLLIEDLNSVNGTAVNRQKLIPNQPQPLKAGDEIRLGKMALIYQVS